MGYKRRRRSSMARVSGVGRVKGVKAVQRIRALERLHAVGPVAPRSPQQRIAAKLERHAPAEAPSEPPPGFLGLLWLKLKRWL